MNRAARRVGFSSKLVMAVALIAIAAGGCKSDKKPPIYAGGGDQDAGEKQNNAGKSGGSDTDGSVTVIDSGSGGEMDAGKIVLPASPKNPWIAFTQIDDMNVGQLFFIKADGSGMKKFKGVNSENEPSWSPDGKKLAFVEYKVGTGNSLHVLDMDKGTESVLGKGWVKLARPRWTPDGATIVVAGTTAKVTIDALFRVDAMDGSVAQITKSDGGDGGHDVSPDGSVFFVRKSGTKFDIFDVSYGADPSTEATRVTTDSNVIGGINMYPDGTKLFYTSSVKSGSTDVNTLTELTIATGDKRAFGDASDEQARPFSGGDKLVVTRHSFDSDAEIAIIGTDGKLIKRLTDNMVFDTAPDASPIESADVSLAKF